MCDMLSPRSVRFRASSAGRVTNTGSAYNCDVPEAGWVPGAPLPVPLPAAELESVVPASGAGPVEAAEPAGAAEATAAAAVAAAEAEEEATAALGATADAGVL